MAQSSRWRAAKSREAMATATAASSAASSATRFRNFSARASVWRISGRPLSSDSMRTPRRLSRSTAVLAQAVKASTGASLAPGAATARR